MVRPGESHYYGTRLDCRAAFVIHPLCRCNNPNIHGNAWVIEGDTSSAMDNREIRISWKELSNRVWGHYAGRPTVSREEEHQAYRYIMHPQEYQSIMSHYRVLNWAVGRRHSITVSPHEEDLQFHNGEGAVAHDHRPA
jgi:hypothetical protein